MKTLYFSILLLVCTISYSQVPEFEFTIHFMDAIGNRDSIVLGYDLAASGNIVNGDFGEQIINAPFDSVFEVRASHPDGLYNYQPTSKKSIIESSCPFPEPYASFYGVGISVQIIHPPLRVWWDKTLFSESIDCRDSSVLVDRSMWFNYPGDTAYGYPPHSFTYMANTDTLVHPMLGAADYQSTYLYAVQGGGQGVIKMLFVGFTYKSLVDYGTANEPSQTSPLDVYPNPASTYIEVHTGLVGQGELSLWDMQGRCLERVVSDDMAQHRFDTKNLTKGAYSVQVLHQGKYYRKLLLVE